MSRTSVVERAPVGKSKDARFGVSELQKVDNSPARRPDFFYLPPAAVVRLALWILDVWIRSIAAGVVAVVAMAYLL